MYRLTCGSCVVISALVVLITPRVYAQAAEASVMHLRDSDGRHEVDFIVEGPDGRVVAVEVKFAAHVRDRHTVGLRWLAERIGDRLADAVIVNTGPQSYRLKMASR